MQTDMEERFRNEINAQEKLNCPLQGKYVFIANELANFFVLTNCTSYLLR